MMANEIKTGKVVGTGAAINIALGFKPDHVRIVNVTDRTQFAEWFRGWMPDGTAINVAAALGPVNLAANGISEYAGADGDGFTIGSALSTNTKDLAYIATRTGE